MASVAVLWVLAQVVLWALRRHPLVVGVAQRMRAPLRALVATIAVRVALAASDVTGRTAEVLEEVLQAVMVLAIAWTLTRVVKGLTTQATGRLELDDTDNLRARSAQTQLVVARRVLTVVIWTVAAIAALWNFESVRALSTGLLASAGLIGVVLGIAGQTTIGNFVAGLQIATSAPIRLDDVVVVEGEFGRVEEITLTYVVVRLWDERRLVLPCLYFLQNPFENWTREKAQIVGPVVFYVDHRVDVPALREELDRVLHAHPLWDQRVHSVQVVDTTPSAVQVRVLVSARNAAEAWDLRCDVREALLGYLRTNQPDALPRVRIEEGPPRLDLGRAGLESEHTGS